MLEVHVSALEACWAYEILPWRLASVNPTATSRIAHEVIWCCFANSHGGAGNDIPVDLYTEHISRILKDCLLCPGDNI